MLLRTAFLGLLTLLVPVDLLAAETAPSPIRQVGNWLLTETENFSICSTRDMDPVELGKQCEALRNELSRTLSGESLAKRWAPKCYVVCHPTEAGYVREVGAGSQQTRGSSAVTIDRGRVTARRIDLRSDRPDPLREALPHELSHVVIAELFADKPCPRWAEEGLAVLNDSARKQGGHRRDLTHAWQRAATFATPELLRLDDYPAGNRRAVFYGQSVSLVDFLVSRESAAVFVDFLRRAGESDYDTALKGTYGISDVGELDRLWKAHFETSLTRVVTREAAR